MPYYPPLYMPEKRESQRGLLARIRAAFSFAPSPEEEHLRNQIQVREPIPATVWGDEARAEMGRFLASLIAERIGWPNDHFIPEDPFEWVMYVIGGEDLQYTEIVMAIEETLGIVIEGTELEMFFNGTLGEVVDYLLLSGISPEWASIDFKPLPVDGPSSVEAKNCPTLATFLELRRALKVWSELETTERISPRTNMRELSESTRRRIDGFVRARFGTGVTPFQPSQTREMLLTSLANVVSAALVPSVFGLITGLIYGEGLVPLLFFVAFFASLAPVIGLPLLFLELLGIVAQKDYWRVRSQSYRRVETVGEFIHWILTQRSASWRGDNPPKLGALRPRL